MARADPGRAGSASARGTVTGDIARCIEGGPGDETGRRPGLDAYKTGFQRPGRVPEGDAGGNMVNRYGATPRAGIGDAPSFPFWGGVGKDARIGCGEDARHRRCTFPAPCAESSRFPGETILAYPALSGPAGDPASPGPAHAPGRTGRSRAPVACHQHVG